MDNIILNDYFAYVTFERNLSPATVVWYNRVLKSYHKFSQEQHHKWVFNAITLRRYLIEQRKRGNNEKSMLNKYQALCVFAKYLIKFGHIKENPMEEIEKPKPKRTLPVFLDEDESKQLLHYLYKRRKTYPHIAKRDILIIGLFLFCGLRRKELLGLRLQNVNIIQGYIKIVEAKMNKERLIPLNNTVKHMFQSYLALRPEDNHDYVFTSSGRYKCPTTYQCIRRLFKEINESVKLQKHVTPHILRHTFCSLLIRKGVNYRDVQMLAGHSDPATTLRFYCGVDERSLRKAVDSHPLNLAF